MKQPDLFSRCGMPTSGSQVVLLGDDEQPVARVRSTLARVPLELFGGRAIGGGQAGFQARPHGIGQQHGDDQAATRAPASS